MKKMLLLPVLASAVLFFSCHKKEMSGSAKETTATTTASVSPSNPSATEIKNVTVDPAADMVNTGAPYSVDSVGISGDILSVFVNYSGGCKDHSFELLSNGMFAKSLPPQVTVCLKHTNNDDACRKLVMQELKFNVSGIKYKSGNGTTVIKLGDKQVTYTGK